MHWVSISGNNTMSLLVQPSRNGRCWADFSSDSESDLPPHRVDLKQDGSTHRYTNSSPVRAIASRAGSAVSRPDSEKSWHPQETLGKGKQPWRPRRFSASTASAMSPVSTEDSYATYGSFKRVHGAPAKQVEDLEAQLTNLRRQLEDTTKEQQKRERLLTSRAENAEHVLKEMERRWWECSAVESQKVKVERVRHLQLEAEGTEHMKLLESKLAQQSTRYAEAEAAMCSLQEVKMDFERAQEAWEAERKTFADKVAANVEAERAMLTVEIAAQTSRADFRRECEETKHRMQEEAASIRARCEEEKAELRGEAASMRARCEEEKAELRESIERHMETLKQTRKDHNVKVQMLQAKIDSARAACHRAENKKLNFRDVELQCSLESSAQPLGALQEVNRKMVQKLVGERQKCLDVMRQKKEIEVQLDLANVQLDDMHCKNGTQQRELKSINRLLREAVAQKDEAITSAECFHDQNKRILEERSTLMAQIRSLHTQITARIWNDKVTDVHGSRLASILMDAGKSAPVRSPTEYSTTCDDVGS